MTPQERAYSLGVETALSELSMEKRAVVLHALGTALGGHFMTNALGRAAHHGSNLAEVMAHQGFQHGLLGQQINPARAQAMKSLLGPEALITYQAARSAAAKAVEQAPNPVVRQAIFEGMLREHAASGLEHAPVIGDIAKAIQHELAGTAPKFEAQGRAAKAYGWLANRLAGRVDHGMETGAQKVVNHVMGAAPMAGFLAADAAVSGGIPLGAVGHFGWNGVRQAAGSTQFGKDLVRKQLASGLKGEQIAPWKELAYDIGASPAFLDAQRAGLAANKANPAVASAASKVVAHPDFNLHASQLQAELPKLQTPAGRQDLLGRLNVDVPGLRDHIPVEHQGLFDQARAGLEHYQQQRITPQAQRAVPTRQPSPVPQAARVPAMRDALGHTPSPVQTGPVQQTSHTLFRPPVQQSYQPRYANPRV